VNPNIPFGPKIRLVKPPNIKSWSHKMERRINDRLTFKRTRRGIEYKVNSIRDTMSLGPLRRKFKVRHRQADAQRPINAKPTCSDFIKKRPRIVRGNKGICEGCGSEQPLRRGKIPPHEPGPPQHTRCSQCGTDLLRAFRRYPRDFKAIRKAGGCYQPEVCPSCRNDDTHVQDEQLQAGGYSW
jgi:hypothetical protein